MFAEHKLLHKTPGPVPDEEYTIPLGVEEVKRRGKDVTIVATSIMLHRALEAAETLAQVGVEAEVVDPRTLKPFDGETIAASVIKTGKVLIVHEACKTGGAAAKILVRIIESEAFDYLDTPAKRLAGLDIPILYNRTVERHTVPQVDNIVTALRELLP